MLLQGISLWPIITSLSECMNLKYTVLLRAPDDSKAEATPAALFKRLTRFSKAGSQLAVFRRH